MKTKFNKWKMERAKKKAIRKFRSRNVSKSKFLYKYFIFSGMFAFLYALSCIITNWPLWYAAAPFVALLSFWVLQMTYKNWKLILLYLRDVEQGELLMYLHEDTHFSEKHKVKLVKWVYPRHNRVRTERVLELMNKHAKWDDFSKEEKDEVKHSRVTCPQQLLDGVNKAILINSLIHAHKNIQVLDLQLRGILELTDENMRKFNLGAEIHRCRTAEHKEKMAGYKRIGMENLKKRKND